MPVYKVKLSDGRTVTIESDQQPTEDEVFSALSSYQPGADKPAQAPADSEDYVSDEEWAASLDPQGSWWLEDYTPEPTAGPPQLSPSLRGEMAQFAPAQTSFNVPPGATLDQPFPAPHEPQLRAQQPREAKTLEDLAYGVGQPLMSEEEERIQQIKDTYGAGEMPTDEFVRQFPHTSESIYGLMSPTRMPTPKLTQQEADTLFGKKVGWIFGGTQRALGNLIDFFTSAPGVMTMMTGGIAGGARGIGTAAYREAMAASGSPTTGLGALRTAEGIHRATAYTFAADMGRHLPDQLIAISDALEAGDKGAALENTLNAGLTLMVMKSGTKALVKPFPRGIPQKYAQQDPQTAEVHERVSPQPQQGAQEVPTAEGGLRVPTSEEGKTALPLKIERDPDSGAYVVVDANGRALSEPASLDTARTAADRLERRAKGIEEGKLSPEEEEYLNRERQALDVDIEVIPPGEATEARPQDPFARQKWKPNEIARPNRITRKIEVNPEELWQWLRTIPAKNRQRAVRSMLWEERFHMEISDQIAIDYWDSLPAWEKAIVMHRYTGLTGKEAEAWSGYGENPRLWGQEAFRMRLQQMARMDVREVIESAEKGLFGPKSMLAAETFLRYARERMTGKKGGIDATGLAILKRIADNVQAARDIQSGVNPSARRKAKSDPNQYQFELPPMPPGGVRQDIELPRAPIEEIPIQERPKAPEREQGKAAKGTEENPYTVEEWSREVAEQLFGPNYTKEQYWSVVQREMEIIEQSRRGRAEFDQDGNAIEDRQHTTGEVNPPVGFQSRERIVNGRGDWRGVREREISPGIWVDNHISDIILRLNQNGYKTMFSDSGLVEDHPLTPGGIAAGITAMPHQAYLAFSRLTPEVEARIREAATQAGFKIDAPESSTRYGVTIRFEGNNNALKRAWNEFDYLMAQQEPSARRKGAPAAPQEVQPPEEPQQPSAMRRETRGEHFEIPSREREEQLSRLEGYVPYQELWKGHGEIDRVHKDFLNEAGREGAIQFRIERELDRLLEVAGFRDDLAEALLAHISPKRLHNILREVYEGATDPDFISAEKAVSKYDPQIMDLIEREVRADRTPYEQRRMEFIEKKLREEGFYNDQITMSEILDNLEGEWIPIREEVYKKNPGLAAYFEQSEAFRATQHVLPEEMTPEQIAQYYEPSARRKRSPIMEKFNEEKDNLIDRMFELEYKLYSAVTGRKDFRPSEAEMWVEDFYDTHGMTLRDLLDTENGKVKLTEDMVRKGTDRLEAATLVDDYQKVREDYAKAVANTYLGEPFRQGEGLPRDVGPGVEPMAKRKKTTREVNKEFFDKLWDERLKANTALLAVEKELFRTITKADERKVSDTEVYEWMEDIGDGVHLRDLLRTEEGRLRYLDWLDQVGVDRYEAAFLVDEWAKAYDAYKNTDRFTELAKPWSLGEGAPEQTGPGLEPMAQRKAKGITPTKEWRDLETELGPLESAMEGAFGDSIYGYWQPFIESLGFGEKRKAKPDDLDLRVMLNWFAKTETSFWPNVIPEWHAKNLERWFAEMEGTGEGRLDRINRIRKQAREDGDWDLFSEMTDILYDLTHQSGPSAMRKGGEGQGEMDFDAAKDTGSTMTPSAGGKEIKLDVNIQQLMNLVGPHMYSKPIQDVAIKELLQNAFDASRSAGATYDNPKVIDVTTDRHNRTLTVEDRGIGMTPEVIQKAFFTIGGTHKEGSPQNTSGGLGLAKMAFILGSEWIKLETVKNGVKSTVRATSDQIRSSSFRIDSAPTTEANGTRVTVKIPQKYMDSTGEMKDIWFSDSPSFLREPLIGPVEVRLNGQPVETGINLKGWQKENEFNFSWGDINLYIDPKRSAYPTVSVLSSGLNQFDVYTGEIYEYGRDPLPHNMLLDVRPKVRTDNVAYPFNNQREGWRSTISDDIKAMYGFLNRMALEQSLLNAKETFSQLEKLPKVDPTKDFTPEEIAQMSQRRQFAPRPEGSKRVARKVDMTQKENVVIEYESGEQETVKRQVYVDKSFKPKREIDLEKTALDPKQMDPGAPALHNNLSVELPTEAYPFFTKMGNTLLKFMREWGEKIERYEDLKNETIDGWFGGISLDKSYRGLNMTKPLKAIWYNPGLMSDAAKTSPAAAASEALHAFIHEITHVNARNEGPGFTAELADNYARIRANNIQVELFERTLEKIFADHWDAFQEINELLNDFNTKNRAASFKSSAALGARRGRSPAPRRGPPPVDVSRDVPVSEQGRGGAGRAAAPAPEAGAIGEILSGKERAEPRAMRKGGEGEGERRNVPMTDAEWQAYLAKLPRDQQEQERLARMRQIARRRRPAEQAQIGQGQLFEAMTAKGIPGAEAGAPVSAGEAGAMPSIKPDAAGEAYLSRPFKARAKGEEGVAYDRPNFREFADWFRANVTGYDRVADHQLRGLWADAVWRSLMKASAERLAEWRRAFGLHKAPKEGGMGERAILELPTPEALRSEGKAAGRAELLERAKRMQQKASRLEKEAKVLRSQLTERQKEEGKTRVEKTKGGEQIAFGEIGLSTRLASIEALAKSLRQRAEQVQAEARAASEAALPTKAEQPGKGGKQLTLGEVASPAGVEAMPTQPILPRESRAALKYRSRLINTIANKLIEEAVPKARDLMRESVTIDDIDFSNSKTVEGAYREIRADEARDTDVLTNILKDQARVSSRDPVSHTRRLVALLNPKTGEVDLVSAYRPRGTKAETLIIDPEFGVGKERPSVPLSRILGRRYRPIASLLLTDPVRNFHQKFKSVREFMDQIGEEASRAERVREYSEFAGEAEALDVSAERPGRFFGQEREAPPRGTGEEFFEETPGTKVTEGEGGLVGGGPGGRALRATLGLGRGAIEASRNVPLTAGEANAVREVAMQEVGKVTSREDMRDAFDGLTDLASRGQLRGIHRQAISALQKAADTIQRENPDWTPDQAWETALEDFYGYIQRTKNEGDFIQAALGRFAKEAPAPVRSPFSPALPARQPTGVSREVTMRRRLPPTVVRPGQLPPGTTPTPRQAPPGVPEGRPGALHPPEILSPQAAAEVAARPLLGEGKLRASGELEPGRPIPEPSPLQMPRPIVPGVPPQLWKEEPGAMRKYSRAGRRLATNIVLDTIVDPLRSYSAWMVDRLRLMGGPFTQQIATVFNRIIDREKSLYGKMATDVLDEARVEAGKPGKATSWAHDFQVRYPGAATSNAMLALENKIAVPPYAQHLITLAQRANLAIGRLYQSVVRGFRASGAYQRNLNAMGYDLIRQGEGAMWERWVRALAHINNVPLAEVKTFFAGWKKLLDEAAPDFNKIERVNQEFHRTYKETVTHISDGIRWHPIMHADLFMYLEAAARRATHIRAFREQFPNTKRGRTAYAQMRDKVRQELGATGNAVFDDLVRALQGHPTDSYSRFGFMAPGRFLPETARFVNQTLGNVMARMVLSGQMVIQLPETAIGSTVYALGEANTFRAWSRLAARKKQLYAELERMGAVNRVLYDWSYDPRSKFRSSARRLGNVFTKFFAENYLNEAQELVAATTALVVAERIEQNTLTKWERRQLPLTLRDMGFTQAEVGQMMQLGSNRALLDQFVRKAAAFLSAGNKAIAEGSPLAANRLFNSVFRFQSYPMMKMNQLRNAWRRVQDAHRTGKGKLAAWEHLSRFLFYTTLQGALTSMLASVAYNSFFGAKLKGHEAADEPFEFLGESFFAAVGGPLYVLWKGMRYQGIGGIGESAARTFFPYAISREILDMWKGNGRYRNKDLFSKLGEFVDRTMPGVRAIKTGLSWFGLSSGDPKLKTSMEGYYRWRLENFGTEKYASNLKGDKYEKFRIYMRKAVRDMTEGDRKGYRQNVARALGEHRDSDWEHIARSLRGQKVLENPQGRRLTYKQQRSLRERIGQDAFRRLRYYDRMLEAAADGVLLYPKE